MKFHYEGKYDGNEAALPRRKRHEPYAQQFKEMENMKKLAIFANILAVVILIVLFIPVVIKFRIGTFSASSLIWFILPLLVLFPHELLHAVCFKEDVYMYTNLKQGLMFVIGPESMTKSRFIFMSLLPNIVFGLIPYLAGLIFGHGGLAAFGAITTAMGAGDYYNVFNAATQMPKGSRTYMYGFHSFWYMPPSDEPAHLSEHMADAAADISDLVIDAMEDAVADAPVETEEKGE